MDYLTHITLSIGLGLLMAKHIKKEIPVKTVAILAFFSTTMDIDHPLLLMEWVKTFFLHNIFYALLLSGAAWKIFGREHAIIMLVLATGNLFYDLTSGLYGITILYPLSNRLYMIPDSMQVFLFGDTRNPIASKAGIALLATGIMAAIGVKAANIMKSR